MNIIQTVRKPYLAFFMASLILFVSCNQYENVNDDILDRQTVEALKKAVSYTHLTLPTICSV